MTVDEAIEMYANNAEYERTHGSLQGCMDFRQLAEWLKDYKRLLEQDPCEDEYIKVPKKALKYRTAGMVAYNAEWLKNHFDIERAVICGAQEPCEDAISRQAVMEHYSTGELAHCHHISRNNMLDFIEQLPSVKQEPKTGYWIPVDDKNDAFDCSECIAMVAKKMNYCPNCGAKMEVSE